MLELSDDYFILFFSKAPPNVGLKVMTWYQESLSQIGAPDHFNAIMIKMLYEDIMNMLETNERRENPSNETESVGNAI